MDRKLKVKSSVVTLFAHQIFVQNYKFCLLQCRAKLKCIGNNASLRYYIFTCIFNILQDFFAPEENCSILIYDKGRILYLDFCQLSLLDIYQLL